MKIVLASTSVFATMRWIFLAWCTKSLCRIDEKPFESMTEFQAFLLPDEFTVGRDRVVVLAHERCRVQAANSSRC
jgi:hypothetical protein